MSVDLFIFDFSNLPRIFQSIVISFFRGVEKILKDPFNVNPNSENKHGVTALWVAAKNNFIDIGLVLLQNGADPNAEVC